jgi:hypothetical protein
MAQVNNNGLPNQTPATAQDCGALWAAAQKGSALFLWRFAHGVARFVAANPKVKLAEIGQACADSCGRAKAYSKGWVSRAVKAAKAFPAAPATPEEAARFADLFHGNTPAQPKASKAGSAEDALAGAKSFAKLAVKRGLEAAAVLAALAAALEGEEGEEAEESPAVRNELAKAQAKARSLAKAAQAQAAAMLSGLPQAA